MGTRARALGPEPFPNAREWEIAQDCFRGEDVLTSKDQQTMAKALARYRIELMGEASLSEDVLISSIPPAPESEDYRRGYAAAIAELATLEGEATRMTNLQVAGQELLAAGVSFVTLRRGRDSTKVVLLSITSDGSSCAGEGEGLGQALYNLRHAPRPDWGRGG